MSWAAFLLTLLVLLAALNLYVYRHAGRALGLGPGGRRALAGGLVVGLIALVLGRYGRTHFAPLVAESLSVAGFTVQLGVVIGGALLLPMDAIRRIAGAARRRLGRRPPEQMAEDGIPGGAREEQWPPDQGRRDFMARSASGAALAVGGGFSLYGSLLGRHDYVIEEVPVALPGLPPTLDGYTIAQLSDIHFGTFVREAELDDAADLVHRARADLVVMTGDLVDHDAHYAPYLGRLVRRLVPLARDGVVAVPGNHDYYTGIDAVLSALTGGGAKVLRNAGRVMGDQGGAFALLGVDDLWSHRFGRGADLDRALAMVPPDLPRVLLCHNPAFFPKAADRVQLQLSGHTHGGQVNVLTSKPAELVLPYGYVAGMYHRGGGALYVNRGFGVAGPPARIGAPPELTRIVLTRG